MGCRAVRALEWDVLNIFLHTSRIADTTSTMTAHNQYIFAFHDKNRAPYRMCPDLRCVLPSDDSAVLLMKVVLPLVAMSPPSRNIAPTAKYKGRTKPLNARGRRYYIFIGFATQTLGACRHGGYVRHKFSASLSIFYPVHGYCLGDRRQRHGPTEYGRAVGASHRWVGTQPCCVPSLRCPSGFFACSVCGNMGVVNHVPQNHEAAWSADLDTQQGEACKKIRYTEWITTIDHERGLAITVAEKE